MDDKNLIPEGALGLMFGAAGAMATKDKEIARLREENASVLRDVTHANTALSDALGERDEARALAADWRRHVGYADPAPFPWEVE